MNENEGYTMSIEDFINEDPNDDHLLNENEIRTLGMFKASLDSFAECDRTHSGECEFEGHCSVCPVRR